MLDKETYMSKTVIGCGFGQSCIRSQINFRMTRNISTALSNSLALGGTSLGCGMSLDASVDHLDIVKAELSFLFLGNLQQYVANFDRDSIEGDEGLIAALEINQRYPNQSLMNMIAYAKVSSSEGVSWHRAIMEEEHLS
jgi:hypothetical protein